MSEVAIEHHDHKPSFFERWFLSTNHKDIGTLYLWLSLAMFIVGGIMALGIRIELIRPGRVLLDPNQYNEAITMHGLVMVFGSIMPAFTGLANWLIPLMIGAPDMAFPRMNNWSFWLIPAAVLILISTLVLPGPAPNFGWTFYAPLSTTYGPPSTVAFVFSVHLLGLSSIMGAINIIATILNLRAPGMTWMRLPMFVWAWFVTAFLLIAVMPVLACVVTMLLTDKYFHTSFFNAAGGGDPLLFQHIFWFFGHPEVYIIILPAFGVVSEIIATFSRKRLFGYHCMVYAIAAIAILSFIVWAHHMFTTGINLGAELFFMYATMIIAVPTGVKVFNWISTMFRGSLTFETPMLFAIGFVIMFTIGGFSGIMLSLAPADQQYHDSYFVVAHFHYVLVSGALFALFGGVYYWLPKWTGHMYNEFFGKMHFWLTLISINLTFFPMHFLGLAGMPRRIPDYALQFADFNLIASLGTFILGLSQLIFIGVIIQSIRGGKSATAQVWEGARGLEWTVPSPAPHHTFATPPIIPEELHE